MASTAKGKSAQANSDGNANNGENGSELSARTKIEMRLNKIEAQDFLAQIEQHAPWETWAEKLVSQKKPLPLRKLLRAGIRNPLSWSICSQMGSHSVELIGNLEALRKGRQSGEPADWELLVSEWHDRIKADGTSSLSFAVESLAWAHALTKLAPRLPAEKWWELFAFLVNTATDAISSLTVDTKHSDPEFALIAQLITGELPLTLGYWFPKIEICHELVSLARASISESILELLDGEGIPHARYGSRLRHFLASWTRSFVLDRELVGKISKEATVQYEWFVRQSMRLRRHDGSFAFEKDGLAKSASNGLLQTAIDIAGDALDKEIFNQFVDRKKTNNSGTKLPPSAEHSEWAELAILRTDWTHKSNYVVVNYSHGLQTEMAVGDRLLLSGIDMPSVKFNGTTVNLDAPWEETCWESDDDLDYVEFECKIDGMAIQRQFLLARRDKFFFTADAVLSESEGHIEYERQLPFVEQVTMAAQPETREVTLCQPTNIGTAMPLSLPEWLAASANGSFENGCLRQTQNGKALCCPLFVDLDPKRRRKALTWRQLTVAERLEIVKPDVAVAFRVQIGDEQWVIYRSLSVPTNRTFLGQNHITEFVVARFNGGEFENLIEVE